MGSEDQALTVHSKIGRRKPNYSKCKDPHHRDNIKRDLSKMRCYTCDERGHFAKDCPKNKNHSHKNKGNKRRHHAHAERMMNHPRRDPDMKVKILQAKMNMF